MFDRKNGGDERKPAHGDDHNLRTVRALENSRRAWCDDETEETDEEQSAFGIQDVGEKSDLKGAARGEIALFLFECGLTRRRRFLLREKGSYAEIHQVEGAEPLQDIEENHRLGNHD